MRGLPGVASIEPQHRAPRPTRIWQVYPVRVVRPLDSPSGRAPCEPRLDGPDGTCSRPEGASGGRTTRTRPSRTGPGPNKHPAAGDGWNITGGEGGDITWRPGTRDVPRAHAEGPLGGVTPF